METRWRKKKKKLRLSKLYAFACGRPSFDDGHSQIGRPGFSHVVQVDGDGSAGALGPSSNYVSTTKYNVLTFVPKSIFEQFRRVANVYFLLAAILSLTPVGAQSKISAVLPITIVILATMVKEAIEDWRRFQQDEEVNNRKVKVLSSNDGAFHHTEWKNLKVGDIVKVEKDHYFPADLLLLSSSYEDGVCYVETMNLDGETNLKVKQSLEITTSELQEEPDFRNLGGMTIRCEDPNADLYTFVGTLEYGENQHPLSPQQLLLRDSKLRNTDHVYGVVVFTGHDTKVMQNSTGAPSKRSSIEKKMDSIIYLMLFLLALISLVGSIFFGITTRDDLQDGKMKRWYLRPDDAGDAWGSFDSKRPGLAAFLHFLTAMILFGYFIPISLYISMEIVKILQVIFINQDIHMYHEETNKPARARTSNLNEELGQVHTILSDKTGTLTCNSMEFIKCSIAGTAYGRGFTEVERAVAKKRGMPSLADEIEEDGSVGDNKIKGYNFKDERLTNGKWVKEPNNGVIRMFFRLLAICHTAVPEVDDSSGKVSYEAESPDEAAFVVAARELGFEFYQRTQTSILLREQLGFATGERIERSYTLLDVLEFNSTRKRMSVIIRDEEGKLMILSKGADSVMFQLLAQDGRAFEEETREHVNEYADAGLRTLILAYRELEEEEYDSFKKVFLEAKGTVGADRDEKVDAAAGMVEKDLILLGATAVEDKLQKGVPDCIDKLAQAEIKIWVLTGDKMETAINIGFACSLLRQEMQQIIVTLDAPDIVALEKEGNKDLITKESKARVILQLTKGRELVNSSSTNPFALIIDGKSLAFALEDDVKDVFLALARECASVICCRSSPKQKALVTRLVKNGTGKTTLAIGDGANDVGMLQEADIGVGISGFEGMQAVMASDIAIAQFRFLERLLLVHGHWCYRRITSMICYFFYKNIAFGLTLFLYEAYASFSGQSAYNDWFLSLYNVFFTSLPAVALGVFDQDVSPKYCLKFPLLYQEGVQNTLFSWTRIIGWMFNGALNATTIFFFCMAAVEFQAFREGGQVASQDIFGVLMYTCVVWVVNCQMALFVRFFTLIQHIFIWGGIALWYLFLLAYGAITPKISTNAYMVFIETTAPAPSYWIITLFVVIATLIPYFSYSAIQVQFFPMFHEQIQSWRKQGKCDDPEYCDMVRQQSVSRNTVGFSARMEAKVKKLKNRIHDAHTPP